MTEGTSRLIGWYSREQEAAWGSCVYLDAAGREVRVTEVTSDADHRPAYADAHRAGPVTEFRRRCAAGRVPAAQTDWAAAAERLPVGASPTARTDADGSPYPARRPDPSADRVPPWGGNENHIAAANPSQAPSHEWAF